MNYLQKKRLAIMRNRQFKRYLKSVSGALPLTVTDGIKGNLVNYIIEGNTVQNGTPTVETPAPIVSVGEETDLGYKIPVTISKGENTVTTPIYLDEPLRRIGDYADYIDFKSKKLVRNIYSLSLNGEERWSLQSTNSYGIANFVCSGIPEFLKNSVAICDKAEIQSTMIANTTTEGMMLVLGAGTPYLYLRLKSSRISTASALKEWLSTENINVIYALKEPVESTVDLPQIPIFNNTSTYSADTSVQPSGMTVEYYAK